MSQYCRKVKHLPLLFIYLPVIKFKLIRSGNPRALQRQMTHCRPHAQYYSLTYLTQLIACYVFHRVILMIKSYKASGKSAHLNFASSNIGSGYFAVRYVVRYFFFSFIPEVLICVTAFCALFLLRSYATFQY